MEKREVAAAETKELVAFYNENAATPVKKFANRAKAESRVIALIDEMEADLEATEVDTFDASTKTARHTGKQANKATKAAINSTGKRTLSEAIAESWKVDETREKRSQRSAVKVSGKEYPSVRKAFIALDLPAGECITFRIKLKAAGTLKGKEAYGKTWTIIPLNYED